MCKMFCMRNTIQEAYWEPRLTVALLLYLLLLLLLVGFAKLISKLNVQSVALKACSVLFEIDESEPGNVLLHRLLSVSWHFELIKCYCYSFENNVPLILNPYLNKSKREIKVHLLKQPCCFFLASFSSFRDLCFMGL